jgi:hypothetical protein
MAARKKASTAFGRFGRAPVKPLFVAGTCCESTTSRAFASEVLGDGRRNALPLSPLSRVAVARLELFEDVKSPRTPESATGVAAQVQAHVLARSVLLDPSCSFRLGSICLGSFRR